MALVRERTIPTERPPPVGEVSTNFCGWRGVTWSAPRIPTAVNLCFLDRSRYLFIQVAPQLTSRGWVDPVPDPLLLRKSASTGNRTRDLCICSQKLWPLDHRGGPCLIISSLYSSHHLAESIHWNLNFSQHEKCHDFLLLLSPQDHKANSLLTILCFVDRASSYNLVNRTNLVHKFS